MVWSGTDGPNVNFIFFEIETLFAWIDDRRVPSIHLMARTLILFRKNGNPLRLKKVDHHLMVWSRLMARTLISFSKWKPSSPELMNGLDWRCEWERMTTPLWVWDQITFIFGSVWGMFIKDGPNVNFVLWKMETLFAWRKLIIILNGVKRTDGPNVNFIFFEMKTLFAWRMIITIYLWGEIDYLRVKDGEKWVKVNTHEWKEHTRWWKVSEGEHSRVKGNTRWWKKKNTRVKEHTRLWKMSEWGHSWVKSTLDGEKRVNGKLLIVFLFSIGFDSGIYPSV